MTLASTDPPDDSSVSQVDTFNRLARDLDRAIALARLSGIESFVLQHAREEFWSKAFGRDPIPFTIDHQALASILGCHVAAIYRAVQFLVAAGILLRANSLYLIEKDYRTWTKATEDGRTKMFGASNLRWIRAAHKDITGVEDSGESFAKTRKPVRENANGIRKNAKGSRKNAKEIRKNANPHIDEAPALEGELGEVLESKERTPQPPDDGGPASGNSSTPQDPNQETVAAVEAMVLKATRGDDFLAERAGVAARAALKEGYSGLELLTCWGDAITIGGSPRTWLGLVATKLGNRKVRGETNAAKIEAESKPRPIVPLYQATPEICDAVRKWNAGSRRLSVAETLANLRNN